MKIGILGSGEVAKSLAKGFGGLGYKVMISSRKEFNEAAKFGDLIVIAVLGDKVKGAVKGAGVENFKGKIVIDVTNPLKFKDGIPSLSIGFNNSNGEIIQKLLPDSFVVKTLNIIGNQSMVNPKFKPDPDMLLCGNNKSAKKKVVSILRGFGWENITDLGGIEQSRILEPLCILWVTYAMKNKNWNIAFKLLKR